MIINKLNIQKFIVLHVITNFIKTMFKTLSVEKYL